jgi:hypothetical protein
MINYVCLYSQNREELIIEKLINSSSSTNFLVDLGAGDGFHLSNSRYFIDKGWSAILIDADNKGNSDVKQHKINRENINQLLKQYNCPKEFEFLSIDLDGNDYWILEEILKQYKPKLIVAEFNAAFTDSRTIKYDPEFSWNGDDYFGFTLEAGNKLAENNGYTLCMQHADMNIFLLRDDILNDYCISDREYKQSDYFKKSNRNDWVII